MTFNQPAVTVTSDPIPNDATVDPGDDVIYEDPETEPGKTDVPGQNEPQENK